MNDRQTEPAAAFANFGRKQRIEDSPADFFADAGAGVTTDDSCLPLAVCFRPDSQSPATRHGVEAVVDEVDEDLLKLFAVAGNGRVRLIQLRDQFDLPGGECGRR